MILPDTSAWIEFLRSTEGTVTKRMYELLGGRGRLATTEPVLMELAAGPRSAAQRRSERALVQRCELFPVDPSDYDTAAAIYRSCRADGSELGGMVDCLIAAVAMRTGAAVLQRDANFEAIAASTGLKLDPV